MQPGDNLTQEMRSEGGKASRAHGMYSMEFSGPDALADPTQITRMAELREILRTQPGRDEVRHELAARLVLMVEMGIASVRERYEGEHVTTAQRAKVWKDPVIGVLPRYISALQKALDSLPKLFDEPKNVTEMLDKLSEDADAA